MSQEDRELEEVQEDFTALVRGLVDDPDAVEVTTYQRGHSVELALQVAPDDVGQVIGRQGRTARALRAMLEARGFEDDRTYGIDIRRS